MKTKAARQGSSDESPKPGMERDCIVLDSSAVLNDFAFFFSGNADYFVTPEIFLEFRDQRSRHICENALHNGFLFVRDAPKEELAEAEKLCSKKKLRASKADKSIVALALGLKNSGRKPQLVTDDYAVQNLCSSLKIPFFPVIRGKINEY